jgi:L-lactate utilization protein LutB
VVKLAQGGEEFDHMATQLRLRTIRADLPNQLDQLVEEYLSQVMEQNYSGSYVAVDAEDAAVYIEKIVDEGEALAINRAGIIGELRAHLEANGHRLVHTYLSEYGEGEDRDQVLHHYWQLPDVSPESALQSFDIQRPERSKGRKDYTALIGVSAASAEDGSVVFLQHTSNISTMLREASKVILIVGVDKIVRTRDDAVFQARSMGAFGLENVVINLSLPDPDEAALELINRPLGDIEAETHIIVLDNGRCALTQRGEFAQLLTCISCQACAILCPTYAHFDDQLAKIPKQYLWSYLLGMHNSLEMCIGCGLCLCQCPLDIDLPRMIATARNEQMTGWINQSSTRLLHDAWWMMYGAHRLAPVANGLLTNPLARKTIERITGFKHDAWLPIAQKRRFTDWLRDRSNRKVGG